jgi:nitroreductase
MIDPKEFLEFIKNRRSIRSFQNKAIPEDYIKMILEAGQWAPSASNRQPWEFIVLRNHEVIEKLAKAAFYGRFIKQASVVVAIIGKPKISPKWYIIDTSLVSMNMMLMAWALGIGTCWIGALNREKAKQILELDKDDYMLTILPFGYIKGEIPTRDRKPFIHVVKEK